MARFHLVDHPLLRRELTVLRDRRTRPPAFRAALRRASLLLAAEAARSLRTRAVPVATPLAAARGAALTAPVVLVPILRAGLGFVEGFLELLPDATVGHLGIYRDEVTLEPVEYYARLPRSLGDASVFVLDPMLATGGSACAAIGALRARGARSVVLVSLVAAPEGVRAVRRAHPATTLITAALDRRLNRHGYIVPGLGDAGDRLFATGGAA